MANDLTREQIEQIRACLDDDTYTKLEQKDFGALCDMALRACAVSATPATPIGGRENALSEAVKLMLDDWANANEIGEDAIERAGLALDMPALAAQPAAAQGGEWVKKALDSAESLVNAADDLLMWLGKTIKSGDVAIEVTDIGAEGTQQRMNLVQEISDEVMRDVTAARHP